MGTSLQFWSSILTDLHCSVHPRDMKTASIAILASCLFAQALGTPIFNLLGGRGGGGNDRPKCKTVYAEECHQTYGQECSTSYGQECSTSYEEECSTSYGQECSTEYEQKCETTQERKCSTSY